MQRRKSSTETRPNTSERIAKINNLDRFTQSHLTLQSNADQRRRSHFGLYRALYWATETLTRRPRTRPPLKLSVHNLPDRLRSQSWCRDGKRGLHSRSSRPRHRPVEFDNDATSVGPSSLPKPFAVRGCFIFCKSSRNLLRKVCRVP